MFYSGSSSPCAHAPETGFSFEEVYSMLLPIRKMGNVEETMSLQVTITNKDRPLFFVLEDKDAMRTLLYTLADKVTPMMSPFVTATQFEEALRIAPLVPGDPPYLKEGETLEEGQRRRREEKQSEAGDGETKTVEAETGAAERGESQSKAIVERVWKDFAVPVESGTSSGEDGKTGAPRNETVKQKQTPLWPYATLCLLALLLGAAAWRFRQCKK